MSLLRDHVVLKECRLLFIKFKVSNFKLNLNSNLNFLQSNTEMTFDWYCVRNVVCNNEELFETVLPATDSTIADGHSGVI